MLKVKNGVTPANLIIAAAAANSAEELKTTVWITSGTDGKHKDGSFHYKGEALDFRTSSMDAEMLKKFMAKMQLRLGADYQLILESDHLHIEHDPKVK